MGEPGILKFFGRRSAACKVTSFLLLFLIVNINVSNCLKTTKSVRKLSKELQPVSPNKFPLLWKPDTVNKTSALAAIAKTVDGCETSSSSKDSAKCRKQKKQQEKLLEKRKKTKTSEKFTLKAQQKKIVPPEVPKSLMNIKEITSENILQINKFVKEKRHYCKQKNNAGFPCKKLKFSMWLAKQMESNNTKLSDWLEIVKRSDIEAKSDTSKDLKEVRPDIWPEKIVYRLIKAWGDPEDLFVFYKYKDFVKSRELKISLPYETELTISPQSSNELLESARSSSLYSMGSPRFFWDPGFNLKLKLPFFRDELKVAVSTGPSFVAGIGVGIALLIVKSMFAPFLFGMKWMMYNLFFKESSPFELMKMFFFSHAPEAFDSNIPPPAIEHYHPPPVRNHFDHPPRGRPPPPHHHPPYHRPPFRGPKGYGPPPPHHHYHHHPHYSDGPPYDHDYHPSHAPPPFDLKHQYTQASPMIQTLNGANPTMSQLEHLYRQQLIDDGLGLKRPTYKSFLAPDPTNSIDGVGDEPVNPLDIGMEMDPQDSPSYIPSTGLQAEVEHFDPFYSPLLSKIDSIFTHLGHSDEGCRERAVCSIYKFPVKYAPYSNLISAQLSKHQSELKRPVTSSAKILRYFRYMKAAKDGQGGENCVDLYPKCSVDTDSVSSLPMIATFHQLSELMTAEPSSPAAGLTT